MNRKQYRRYHSPVITAERERIEKQLSALTPLTPEMRHFLSFEGFAELYLRMRDLYPTQLEAYERLEDFISPSPVAAVTRSSVRSGEC